MKLLNIFFAWMVAPFCVRRSDFSTLRVVAGGHLMKDLTRKQRKIVYQAEVVLEQTCAKFSIDCIPFDDFFGAIMPEAASLPFQYRLGIWDYYHRVEKRVRTGKSFLSPDPDPFHAAIVIAAIIREADRYVVINANCWSWETLRFQICQSAMQNAMLQGTEVNVFNCKSYDAFSVYNDRGMRRQEKSFCDHSAYTDFKARF